MIRALAMTNFHNVRFSSVRMHHFFFKHLDPIMHVETLVAGNVTYDYLVFTRIDSRLSKYETYESTSYY
jgi:hypothetical protein